MDERHIKDNPLTVPDDEHDEFDRIGDLIGNIADQIEIMESIGLPGLYRECVWSIFDSVSKLMFEFQYVKGWRQYRTAPITVFDFDSMFSGMDLEDQLKSILGEE